MASRVGGRKPSAFAVLRLTTPTECFPCLGNRCHRRSMPRSVRVVPSPAQPSRVPCPGTFLSDQPPWLMKIAIDAGPKPALASSPPPAPRSRAHRAATGPCIGLERCHPIRVANNACQFLDVGRKACITLVCHSATHFSSTLKMSFASEWFSPRSLLRSTDSVSGNFVTQS